MEKPSCRKEKGIARMTFFIYFSPHPLSLFFYFQPLKTIEYIAEG